MPESIRQEKPYYQINRGLNTESSELGFPDGFSTDERNYELRFDGSRRRRKGLAEESGGTAETVSTTPIGHNSSFVWTNVGGDPTKTFVVHKFGSMLYFTDDDETISTTYRSDTIELDNYKVTSSSVSADSNPAQFTAGRGYLLVTGPGHYPIVVQYNDDTDDFTVETINPVIRDYGDQDDGLNLSVYPTTLSDEFKYNLLNRGWDQTLIDLYNTGASQYPNKSVPWFRGFAREVDGATYINEDGVKAFNHLKYTAEPTSSSSAPLGSLFITPIDSSYASSDGEEVLEITALSYVDGGSTWTYTVTTASVHGYSVSDEVTIDSTASRYLAQGLIDEVLTLDGPRTVASTPTTTTFTFTIDEPPQFSSMTDVDFQLGTVSANASIVRPSGAELNVAPRACAFHDGRVFYAGLDDQEWSDYVFFTQIPDKKAKFSKCYQVADPTDPENNLLVDTDGGYFVLQGVQGVKKLLSVRGSLLVFASNGVWEVSGGQRGFFTPTNYSIRKLTEVGCDSPYSPITVENTAYYTSPEGVYYIAPNQYTGLLEVQSISKDLIQTRWNNISATAKKFAMSVYDDSKKRVWFLYGKTSATASDETQYYTDALILDVEIPAWYPYNYRAATNSGIMQVFPITETTSTEQQNKLKFQCHTAALDIATCDHAQTDYLDFDGSESPLPYFVTGWDGVGDGQRRKQAPVVTVFAKRTETGYTATGNGYDPVNESSTLMTPYWDWTDDSVSGKIGTQSETYRHVRGFAPSGTDDVDGYPVVVTRNKVRGRGRVLQLRFDGAATKDSHLLGFHINYRITRKI